MNGIVGDACADCIHFAQYYSVKCFHNFESTEFGFCGIKNQTVKRNEACDNFCRQRAQRITAEEIENAVSVLKDLKELL